MIFNLYLRKLYNFPIIDNINYKSINSFNICNKNMNNKMNKYRENIIISIINNKIPKNYYKYSNRWRKLRDNIYEFILFEMWNIQGLSLENIKEQINDYLINQNYNQEHIIQLFYDI